MLGPLLGCIGDGWHFLDCFWRGGRMTSANASEGIFGGGHRRPALGPLVAVPSPESLRSPDLGPGCLQSAGFSPVASPRQPQITVPRRFGLGIRDLASGLVGPWRNWHLGSGAQGTLAFWPRSQRSLGSAASGLGVPRLCSLELAVPWRICLRACSLLMWRPSLAAP